MTRSILASWPLAGALVCIGCPGGAGTDDSTGTPPSTGGPTTGPTTGPGDTTGPTPTTGIPGTTNGDTTAVATTAEPTTGPGETTSATTGEPPNLQSSVTQYGITWTFDAAYPVGQFVTGDWWVVGPLTIVSVDPAPAAGRNGSMLDPVGEQDYDSRAGEHSEGKRVTFPVALEGTHSLVSAISHPDAAPLIVYAIPSL